MQLNGLFHRRASKGRVRHIAELLANRIEG
jgi:hypothetical protein